MMLAVQADGSSVETVEGLADGEELNKLQQAFTRSPRAAVRRPHARDADERNGAAAREPASLRARDQEGRLQGNICRALAYWFFSWAVLSVAPVEGATRVDDVIGGSP